MNTQNNHYVALVPMDGDHEGKIGQHSCNKPDISSARKWAEERFDRPAVVVRCLGLSFETEEAIKLYNEGIK